MDASATVPLLERAVEPSRRSAVRRSSARRTVPSQEVGEYIHKVADQGGLDMRRPAWPSTACRCAPNTSPAPEGRPSHRWCEQGRAFAVATDLRQRAEHASPPEFREEDFR